MNELTAIDAMLAAWLAPLPRIILWGIITAIFSMGCYGLLNPKEKIAIIRQQQKNSRGALLRYDGNWDGMWKLICRDLSLAFKQLGFALIPFIVSVAPVVVLMDALSEIYGDAAYSHFGPTWSQDFEFWYVASALIASLFIKIVFKVG